MSTAEVFHSYCTMPITLHNSKQKFISDFAQSLKSKSTEDTDLGIKIDFDVSIIKHMK